MDKATVFGLILGAVVLSATLIIGQVPYQALLQPEALLIVFGGTLTAVMVSFSSDAIGLSLRGLKRCLFRDRFQTPDCIDYLTEIASFVRSEGILTLQPLLAEIEIPFVRKGLQLIIDNWGESFIRESLTTDIEVAYRDDLDVSRVFEAAGGFAPTMGIIGAVIGLIHVVNSFQNPGQLAQGVAGAFSATLYGVALSNLFLLPLAGKLRQRARDEWFRKTLLLEGIMSIRAGDHPMVTEERLKVFLNGVRDGTRDNRYSPEEAPMGVSNRELEAFLKDPVPVKG